MPVVLKLDQECAIYQATQLRQQLSDALIHHDGLQLDLSAVAELDCSVLQILLWLRHEGERLAKNVSFIAPSEAVMQLIGLTGLYAALPMPDVVEAVEAVEGEVCDES